MKERLVEKERLDEMAIQVVSARKDGLPFRIAVMSPDHQPPHAHLMDLKTGKVKLGQFEISKKPPRDPYDIKGYKIGISQEARQLIFAWANKPHQLMPKISNWEALCLEWQRNEKW